MCETVRTHSQLSLPVEPDGFLFSSPSSHAEPVVRRQVRHAAQSGERERFADDLGDRPFAIAERPDNRVAGRRAEPDRAGVARHIAGHEDAAVGIVFAEVPAADIVGPGAMPGEAIAMDELALLTSGGVYPLRKGAIAAGFRRG